MFILMAFTWSTCNEIVLSILLMSYLSTGSMIEFESIDSLRRILLDNAGPIQCLNTMLFCLLHWPCATSLLTIKKKQQVLNGLFLPH